MTHEPVDHDVTTDEEFEVALGKLLLEAVKNGIDLKGSWVYRNGEVAPDWEVTVVELEKRDVAD